MDVKRTVHGVGYNSGGRHIVSIKCMRTSTYMTWYNMMTRCYSEKLHNRLPQYKNCEVDEVWKDFQGFAEWYEGHDFAGLGYHLDKDLLVSGNELYSPDNCCLLPQELNKLITSGKRSRDCLVGTHWSKRAEKWLSSVSVDNKQVHLGTFDTELEAHLAYIKSKEILVRQEALFWFGKVEPRAYEALISWRYNPA